MYLIVIHQNNIIHLSESVSDGYPIPVSVSTFSLVCTSLRQYHETKMLLIKVIDVIFVSSLFVYLNRIPCVTVPHV